MKPANKPNRPYFSSGPCSKRPGWSLSALENALVGRSHRAKNAKARIQEVIDRSKELLNLPEATFAESFPHPTPALWKWLSGPCSALAAST